LRRREAALIKDGRGDQMPTGRCELGGVVCDLTKGPPPAVSTLRQLEARRPVEGFFCFEINNRNAVRRRWGW
jgi:hypothetical protein